MIVQEQHDIESYLFWDVFSKLTCYFLHLKHNICVSNKFLIDSLENKRTTFNTALFHTIIGAKGHKSTINVVQMT